MSTSDAILPAGTAARAPRETVGWRPWTRETFERAARERKPILLSITASWCRGCAVMDRTSYADAGIVATINHRFVPVRVDADRRPDVHDRYNLEGLPTTAFLTPSGEILTGSTYLPPERLATLLVEVADAYGGNGEALDRRATEAAASRRAQPQRLPLAIDPDLAAPAWLVQQVVEQCDPEHGGFGTGGKFLEAPVLRAAIAEYRSSRVPALGHAITLTLDGMAQGGMRDRVEGGFFRYAAARDWTRPHTEKLLEDQVGLVDVYLTAAEAFGRRDWREVALETLRFVTGVLTTPDGAGFYASRAGDDSYYQLGTVAARRQQGGPPLDRTLFTDVNAQAVSAWLRASALLDEPALGRQAEQVLDRVLAAARRPGGGVAHWAGEAGDTVADGLLADQVHAAAALLDLHAARGDDRWVQTAGELMRNALDTLWDGQDGGFFDRVAAGDDLGLLADRRKPLAANCLAARVLGRLATLTGDAGLQERAIIVLRSQTGAYRRHGLAGAPYAAAVRALFG